MTTHLYIVLLSLLSSAVWGRSLQEDLGGTPEAPFGLTAGLVGVGGAAAARPQQESEEKANSGVMIAVIMIVILMLLCCACICGIGFCCLKKGKRDQEEQEIMEKAHHLSVGVPIGGHYSDSPSMTSKEFD